MRPIDRHARERPATLRGLGISEQSYYRWRSEYGGWKFEQARRMKDLEKENGRLKNRSLS
jgi:hypothetical protein